MFSRPLVLLLLAASTCQAELIDVSFDVNLIFADGVLRDANPEGPTLAPVVITRPTDPIPNSVANLPTFELAEFDLEVPGIDDLVVGGPVVFSDPGGTLTITLADGQAVRLTLSELQISYSNANSVLAVFGQATELIPAPDPSEMTEASADIQVDPGLDPGSDPTPAGTSPVSIVFSARVGTTTTDNPNANPNEPPSGTVTGFTAEANGDISGAVLIPEPSTAALVCLVALAGIRRRVKRD